jgi:hypothetical protein
MSIAGGTGTRISVYDFTIGSQATPGDVAATYGFYRYATAAATGTALAENPLNPADPAATAVAVDEVSAEPTTKAYLIEIPLNQRATFRWVASPGSEFVVPATANNGCGFDKIATGSSFAWTVTAFWFE